MPHLENDFPIDWTTILVGLAIGAVVATSKLADHFLDAGLSSRAEGTLASALTIGYIIWRARREPKKLDEWGITTPLSRAAILVAFALLGLSILFLAGVATAIGAPSTFDHSLISDAIVYLTGAFPQQFFLCSVGLVTISRLLNITKPWRLSLVLGIIFSVLHFWTPARIPGTIVPVQMLITLPAGFIVTYYFLKFRSIIPLVILHAAFYPMMHRWIEESL